MQDNPDHNIAGFNKDRRDSIRCPKCSKLLCKVDSDGTVHIKPTRGPQIIIGMGSKIMFMCDRIVHVSEEQANGEKLLKKIMCGNKTLVESGEVVNESLHARASQ